MNIRPKTLAKLQAEFPDAVELVAEATILRAGWEMDNDGWIFKLADGSLAGFTTNHGHVCRWGAEDMKDEAAEMERAAASVRAAVALLAEADAEAMRK